MILGKTLYGRNNELVLAKGTPLSRFLIDGVKRLGYSGIYIDDDLSKDIEISQVISENVRLETVKGIKKTFLTAERGKITAETKKSIVAQIDSIVSELLENRNLMVNMIDLKCFDNYTYAHSVNVAVLSLIIGISMGMKKDILTKLGLGAIMHDIGKVFVNKNIINKPGKLTNEEYEEMKTHSLSGYRYVREKFKLPSGSYDVILDHHEKFDGSGYPHAKAGTDISLFGRIAAIADVYDALTSERPYRAALNPSESVEYIMGNCGTCFDADLVRMFVKKVAPYPVGTTIKLSNGCTGLVVENYETHCLRPRVRIFKEGEQTVPPYEINLKDDYGYLNVTIEGILSE
jgi:HD-GYP domain-containing protein (c-di-GMP phosphodiesterase class II)